MNQYVKESRVSDAPDCVHQLKRENTWAASVDVQNLFGVFKQIHE